MLSSSFYEVKSGLVFVYIFLIKWCREDYVMNIQRGATSEYGWTDLSDAIYE